MKKAILTLVIGGLVLLAFFVPLARLLILGAMLIVLIMSYFMMVPIEQQRLNKRVRNVVYRRSGFIMITLIGYVSYFLSPSLCVIIITVIFFGVTVGLIISDKGWNDSVS